MKEVSCNIIRDILPLYIDGAVCSETAELVEAHLSGCDDCRRKTEQMKADIDIPADAGSKKVLKRLKRSIRLKRAAAAAVTAILAVLVFGIWLYPRTIGTLAHTQNLEMTAEVRETSEGEKEFYLEFSSTVGKALRGKTEFVYSDSNEVVGEVITLYQVKKDRFFGEDDMRSYAFSFDEEQTNDFTVTLHFMDKDITYSMRDMGVIE